jgi:FtsP/CotA-like multicopper oxidase with cupredoxin domain
MSNRWRTRSFRHPSSPPSEWTRRQFLAAALAFGGAAATLACGGGDDQSGLLPPELTGTRTDAATTFRWKPFSVDLAIPGNAQPVAPFDLEETARLVYRKEWRDRLDLFGARYFDFTMKPGYAEIIPGVQTPIWGYDGIYPGPTIRARAPGTGPREVVFVRFRNELPVETVIHLHGGHMPADSDGFTNDFIHEHEFRDYAYPMLPAGDDPAEMPSYLWYHDHAMDETGPNVYRGLSGLFLVVDDAEAELVDRKVIPAAAQEIPLLLQDRSFNADGSLFYDHFDHDGFLGDVQIVNGKAQPKVHVQRRKYRLRFLNGANARMFDLRLSSGAPFVQIGADGCLLPRAVARRDVFIAMAERADVVVDFSGAPDEVYLVNVLDQDDGRGPGGKRGDLDLLDRGVPILKFVVGGSPVPNDVTIRAGDIVKPLAVIRPEEATVTRRFEFDRSGGAWRINDRLFDPDRADAKPRLGATERWVLENKGGGWWHPIHIHLEYFQVQRINGRRPPEWERGLKDTINLGPNDVAEVLMRFRDWPGKWVFHCHNIEHEDMRMMGRFDVVGTS